MKTANLRGAVYLSGGLGLLVALFAAAEFATPSLRSVCSINAFVSCAAVDRSGHTTTLGIPDYAWGIGGFLALLVLAGLAEQRPRDPRRAYALAGLATAAVALSGYFLYVQLGEVHALCVVCASAETLGAILWVSSLALARRTASEARGPAPGPPPTAPGPP